VRKIRIPHRGPTDLVEAELHDDLSVEDLFLAERSWTVERASIMAELRRRSVPRSEWPEPLHWNWWRKAEELELLGTTQLGIFCEGRWQALMMTKTVPYTARLAPDQGKPLVYVDYVEVAPWNWKIQAIDQDRDFLALGATLLKVAVVQSLKEEFHGRVGLHALPGAEKFYLDHGMVRLAPDAHKQNLVYFEFSRENAEHFVTKGSRP
jgi:hypothetical protein